MKVVAISDTHGQHEHLKVPDGDVLVHCGDFSNMGTEKELIKLAQWLKRLPHANIFLSPGNHDGMTQDEPARAKEIIEGARSGVRLMLHEALDFGGKKWFFSPWTPEFCGWWWMLEEPELSLKWAEIPEDTEILITHGPPKMILDDVERDPGYHAGSASLYSRVQNLPRLKQHWFGHLHNSGGQTIHHNSVAFSNAAVLDDRNNFKHHPQVFEI